MKPFEPPKSFELAKQLQSFQQTSSDTVQNQSNSLYKVTDNSFESNIGSGVPGYKSVAGVQNNFSNKATEKSAENNVGSGVPTGYTSAGIQSNYTNRMTENSTETNIRDEFPTRYTPAAETQSNFSNKVSENSTETNVGGGLPAGYTPVVPLEPLKPFEPFNETNSLEAYKPAMNSTIPDIIGSNSVTSSNNSTQKNKESTTKVEIEEGKAKNTLKEIISEIDMYAEKDKELKDNEVSQAQKLESFNSNTLKVGLV